ncbi:TetR/AcrR family transcriptional regulator [Sphingobium amiense]|nr:TetR/AcrR family transcriptional regulator [Sphingobium amiense]
MARPREFDSDQALDEAIAVFGAHGFEGTSAQMLVEAMGIGRQSLYGAFGDKWQLYRAAVRRYGQGEIASHLDALRSGAKAIDGIEAMLRRVVATADQPCLGVGSICEFGRSRPDLTEIRTALGKPLADALAGRVAEAQQDGDIAATLDPGQVAGFLVGCIAGVGIAGRAGADRAALDAQADLALRALR